MKSTEYMIIGGGPTGLGAAHRLDELGHNDWVLVEKAQNLGGLASSVVDDQGFIWDLGGHVLFSHYNYFDNLLDDLLGENWFEHEREAWIWMRNQWIPYPFQSNMWRLPQADLEKCLLGLESINENKISTVGMNFDEWIVDSFGEGIADVFMRPYNYKVWAYPTRELAANWTGERVATIDKMRYLKISKINLILRVGGLTQFFVFLKRVGQVAFGMLLAVAYPKIRLFLILRFVKLSR